jgi:hypothetical protein
MAMGEARMNTHVEMLRVYQALRPGDFVELEHEVKVGFRTWKTTTLGKVVKTDRRRHGLHHRRNRDDKAFSDILVLQREDGELTTVTLDEFTQLRTLDRSE